MSITADQQHLLDIMLDMKHYDPAQRADAGRQLDALGDPRRGVGLRPDGLPDLLWCEVPAGACQLGSPADSDNPPRTVHVDHFWITKYPITYRQFQAFLDDPDGYANPLWWRDLHPDAFKSRSYGAYAQAFKYWNHPRDNVSWYDAMPFCAWLSAKLGSGITLPTEDQWEKAARGIDGRMYAYGNDFAADKANAEGSGIDQTSAVGIFPDPALPYGLMDMCGNVSEWCLNEYYGSGLNLLSNDHRSMRGGSWYNAWDVTRASYRDGCAAWGRNDTFGFRVVASR